MTSVEAENVSKKTYREAVKEAIAQEMQRDPSVVLIGEDVRGGHAGTNPDLETKKIEAFGGVLGVTKGLWTEFGSERVIDTPITESAIIGMAAGAALTGLRPVAELMFMDFFGVSYDALYNQAAKFRYMFGGKARTPLVVRGMIGAGFSAAAQHSQSPYNVFAAVPGLKVVAPSNAYDAKGLLIQAIRDDDPVVFCEHKVLYDLKDEVPDEPYTIPFGVANYTRQGDDVTIIALSAMVNRANDVADKLAAEGIFGRGCRSSYCLSLGRGRHPRIRRVDWKGRDRRRIRRPLRLRARRSRADRHQGIQLPESADRTDHAAAHAGSVLPDPRNCLAA